MPVTTFIFLPNEPVSNPVGDMAVAHLKSLDTVTIEVSDDALRARMSFSVYEGIAHRENKNHLFVIKG